MKLATVFIMWVGIADYIFKVRGQRSRSYVYKCVNAIMAEAYILTRLTCLFYVLLLQCNSNSSTNSMCPARG